MPSVGTSVALLAAVASISASPALQSFLGRSLSSSSTMSTVFKLFAILYVVLNFKNLPGVWHIRVFRGMIYQLWFNRNYLKTPKHLFTPMVTESTNTLMDCDYNIHKSNSTYFADLDVSRAHALSAVIRTGLTRLNKGDQEGLEKSTIETKGRYGVALGAVSCFFLRQIDPLSKFEIYTRVLSWDRKWLYLISHIVRKGAIRPESYVLQPWKNSKRKPTEAKQDARDFNKNIYATSVSRYVFKKGRLTINPELVLERSRLLPPRPSGVSLPPRAEASNGDVASASSKPGVLQDISGPESAAGVVAANLTVIEDGAKVFQDEWTWEDMEAERLRGLKLAAHLDALNDCHGELRADEVLGKYGDYW